MFLARKIARAKWAAKDGLSESEIPADAVTADLKTQQNSLSFWRCPSDEKHDIEEAVLAIAAAGDRVDRLDIVWIADEELQADGQSLKDTAGRTPVTDMVAMHVDVSRLDYVRLGNVPAGSLPPLRRIDGVDSPGGASKHSSKRPSNRAVSTRPPLASNCVLRSRAKPPDACRLVNLRSSRPISGRSPPPASLDTKSRSPLT